MNPIISRQVPILSVGKGDAIVGSDTRLYLIEAIEALNDVQVRIHATGPDGERQISYLATNSCVDAVLERAQTLEFVQDRMMGFKYCTGCEQSRSVAREWDESDYVCKVCRHLLDSEA